MLCYDISMTSVAAITFQVDELDGDGAAGVVVEGLVHAAVPALPDLSDQLVPVSGAT